MSVRLVPLKWRRTIQGWYEADGPMQTKYLVRTVADPKYRSNPRWHFLICNITAARQDRRLFKTPTEALEAAINHYEAEMGAWLLRDEATRAEAMQLEAFK